MVLSIIMPTKDRGEVFDRSLRSAIDALHGVDGEIIVVNDSKTSVPSAPALPHVQVVNNPKSGVASARNFGASLAKGDLFLFIDDDIIISQESIQHVLRDPDFLTHACTNVNWTYPPESVELLQQSQFGRFLIHHDMISFKGWYKDPSWRDHERFPSKSVASFHLLVTRENFKRSGGYDESFPFAGFEDFDFPLRLKKVGVSFFIDTRVTVYHNEADRMKLPNWLNGQQRRAVTRHVAVDKGYTELTLHYSSFKAFMLKLLSGNFWLKLISIVPNHRAFDPLYFKWVGALEAARIYVGYTSHRS